MEEKRGLYIILISSILAIITSGYLLNLHYSETESFCDVSQEISCDIVNKSIYSEIYGIPVSLLGMLTFIFISVLVLFALNNKKIFGFEKQDMYDWIFWIMIFSIFFALYLVYIEIFVLYAVCPLCVLLDILIVIVFVVVMKLRGKK
ncbi:hypothetical protein CL617_02170 [archaeon]|nr:hypothetical protein [archaeon]|tara:strand:+ start:6999 stop:7439 length:441 start_codon:yes stop_codon:yes gene_type:complete